MTLSKLVTYVLAGCVSCSAYAAFTDTHSDQTSTWKQVKTTVKVTVERWLGFWGSDEATPAQPQEAKRSASGSSTQSSVAGAGETTPLPPATPPAPDPSPAPANKPAEKFVDHSAPIHFKTDGTSLQEVQSARDQVKATPLMKVTQPGRVGTSNLPKSNVGVPVTNWAALRANKKISRLDIGTENLISREDFHVSKLAWGLYKAPDLQRMPSPAALTGKELASVTGTPVPRALGPRGLQANIRSVQVPLTLEQVQSVQYKVVAVADFKPLPYKPLTEDQLKMLAALILFDKGGHCHMIMGLFHQLATVPVTKVEATYHLGACAAQLKMHQSAYENLSAVLMSGDKDFGAPALITLAKDLPALYEKDFYQLIKDLKNSKNLLESAAAQSKGVLDVVHYRMSKGAYKLGEFKTSGSYAEMVTEKSEFHDEAAFLSAMNSFALGDKAAALRKLQALWSVVEPQKSPANSNIRALTSLNLARMFFAQKKYDKAFEHYMQVPKDHPLWVQALIEQGWTQVALEDFSGAIGNMYSLHSPYFKAVYQPESFVVRTIGYLNICQYGDAYRTLSFLEKDYREWSSKLGHYMQAKNSGSALYSTVRNYIRGKSTEDVEGVPYQVWREIAHRKDFLNMQTALNDKADESQRYEGVNSKIKSEKASIRWRADQAKKRFDQWRGQIAKAKVDRNLQKHVDQWTASMNLERDLVISYRFQLAVLEQGRQGYLDFQKKSQSNLDREVAGLSQKTGEVLLNHVKRLQSEMSRVLDNNEFLRYEVFAGSGENIRYQVAGGEVAGANRIPASIRPAKMMNWSFDGEFWEDEIGSYRSSLQNNCPNTGGASDQANATGSKNEKDE